jgi:hypothetical protein
MEYMVSISDIIRQKKQEIEALEWDEDFITADLIKFELDHIIDYQISSGSMLYPMF